MKVVDTSGTLESRKRMNETKKLYSILIVIVVIIGIFIASAISSHIKGQKYVEIVNHNFESKESHLVYLGRPTCGYCSLLKPYLDTYSKKYHFTFDYINTDNVTKSQLNTILKKFNLSSDTFGTPYLAVVKNGKKVAEQNGYVPENQLFDFLKEHKFIEEDKKLYLNYIDYDQYKKLLEKGDKELFVFVQTGCSHCENAKPVLEQIAEEYNMTIHVFNISQFEDEQQQKDFTNSLSYYNEHEWGTPLMLVVENKEVKASKEGFESKDSYINFFKEQGFIKE